MCMWCVFGECAHCGVCVWCVCMWYVYLMCVWCVCTLWCVCVCVYGMYVCGMCMWCVFGVCAHCGVYVCVCGMYACGMCMCMWSVYVVCAHWCVCKYMCIVCSVCTLVPFLPKVRAGSFNRTAHTYRKTEQSAVRECCRIYLAFPSSGCVFILLQS